MKLVSTLLFVSVFFLFRPHLYLSPGPIYGGDDYSYFAYSTAFAFGTYPHFDKEFIDEGGSVPPLSRIGPGLMAAPLVTAFSLIDRVTGSTIVNQRTRENVSQSWSAFGSVLSSLICLWFACYLLFLGLKKFVPEKYASWAIILMVLAQGTPLFAIRRGVFSHVYELLIQSIFFFFFSKALTPKKSPALTSPVLIGGTIILLCLVRQNGLLYATVWPALIYYAERLKFDAKFFRKYFATVTLSFSVYYGIKWFPYWINAAAYKSANESFESTDFLYQLMPISFYFERLCTVLVGIDWGLIFTAPFLILGFIALFALRFANQNLWKILLLPFFLNLYIVLIWRGQGSWYGYRYLVFSAFPTFILPFALLLNRIDELTPSYRQLAIFLVSLLTLAPLASMCLFEGGPGFWLSVVKNKYGYTPWTQPTLQRDIWFTILHHPVDAILILLKSGPTYIAYVIATFLGIQSRLPEKFLKVYPYFDWPLLIRTSILYLCPWGLYRLFPIDRDRHSEAPEKV